MSFLNGPHSVRRRWLDRIPHGARSQRRRRDRLPPQAPRHTDRAVRRRCTAGGRRRLRGRPRGRRRTHATPQDPRPAAPAHGSRTPGTRRMAESPARSVPAPRCRRTGRSARSCTSARRPLETHIAAIFGKLGLAPHRTTTVEFSPSSATYAPDTGPRPPSDPSEEHPHHGPPRGRARACSVLTNRRGSVRWHRSHDPDRSWWVPDATALFRTRARDPGP